VDKLWETGRVPNLQSEPFSLNPVEPHRSISAEVMGNLVYAIGLLAAALTSLSYLPQVRKAFPRGATKDLSFKTLTVLATGLALWIAYGLLNGDSIIVIANVVGLSLVGILLGLKLRDSGSMRPSSDHIS